VLSSNGQAGSARAAAGHAEREFGPGCDACEENGSRDGGKEKGLELPADKRVTGSVPVRQAAIKTSTQAHAWPAANSSIASRPVCVV
jgi:hypothetical protein